MRRAASLISALRATGASIGFTEGKLIFQAPPGVLTSEIRAQLTKLKPELLRVLEHESVKDSVMEEAWGKIASMLVVAYQRHAAFEKRADHGKAQLANSSVQSVHGGGS
jgi:hypothetical protein